MIWWFLYQPMMAQAEGDQVSVVAVTAIIGAVFAGLAGLVGKNYGEKRAREVMITPNPLPVELVKTLATKEDLEEVESQLETRITRVEDAAAEDRKVLRHMEGKIHDRVDQMAEKLNGMSGELKKIGESVGLLLELKMKEGK